MLTGILMAVIAAPIVIFTSQVILGFVLPLDYTIRGRIIVEMRKVLRDLHNSGVVTPGIPLKTLSAIARRLADEVRLSSKMLGKNKMFFVEDVIKSFIDVVAIRMDPASVEEKHSVWWDEGADEQLAELRACGIEFPLPRRITSH